MSCSSNPSTLEHRQHTQLDDESDDKVCSNISQSTTTTHPATTAAHQCHQSIECPYALPASINREPFQESHTCQRCFCYPGGEYTGYNRSCSRILASCVRSDRDSAFNTAQRSKNELTEQLDSDADVALHNVVATSTAYSDFETTELLVSEDCPDCIAMTSGM